MKTQQLKWSSAEGWMDLSGENISENAQLLLIFGSGKNLKNEGLIGDLKARFPKAEIMGCSTSGEIFETSVKDDTIVATAVYFEKSFIKKFEMEIDSPDKSYSTGKELVDKFDRELLKHVFVLSDGLNVNGSELVAGMRSSLKDGVSVTGGLAGDGTDFKETVVINGEKKAQSKIVSAIGVYGDDLAIGYGSFGGWDSFGLERLVTRSKANVLYELDNSPALELYKSFLGEQADHLPSSGLLFPLSMRVSEDSLPVVRTILATDDGTQSLTFAGDIPEGSYVRLMKSNIDRLIDGAVTAANTSLIPLEGTEPDLAILISCVGRKLVLKQIVEEEVEGVKKILGDKTTITGFYSYGEISPFSKDAKCELHNQTMTITTFKEY